MPTGSCFCGKTSLSYDADPAMKALCHCRDCQKISGGPYSANLVIPDATFKWTGQTPKPHTTSADSGKKITSYFCPDCGTTLARISESFEGMVIIKAGVVEGGLEMAKPDAELYTPMRASWVAQAPGTQEMKGMS